MKYFIAVLFMATLSLGYSQSVFKINDLSKGYYGQIYVANTSAAFSEGWVAIHESKTKKQLIKVEASELAIILHDGKPVSNVAEFPYGEFSPIIQGDFNFDGKLDFAIEDGQNSCYHGPSFKIYLANKKGFVLSKAFTNLAQDYCGMFQVDTISKTIEAFRKDGCCYHENYTFIIKNNKPKLKSKDVEDTRNESGE
jgi:hypothetical protein